MGESLVEPSAGKKDGDRSTEDYASMARVTLVTAIPSLSSNPSKLEKIVATLARDAEEVFGSPKQQLAKPSKNPTVPPLKRRPETSKVNYSDAKMNVIVWSFAYNNKHLTPQEMSQLLQLGSGMSANGAVSYLLNCGPNELYDSSHYIRSEQRTLDVQYPEKEGNLIKLKSSDVTAKTGTFEGSKFHLWPSAGRRRRAWGPVVIVHGELATPLQHMKHYFEVSATLQLDSTTQGLLLVDCVVPERAYGAVSANKFALLEQMVRATLPQDLVGYVESKPVVYSAGGNLEQRSIFNAPRMIVKAT